MSLTRRRLLIAAGAVSVAAVAVAGGGAVVANEWWDQPAEAPLAHLSAGEIAFLNALADSIFPPSPAFPVRGRDASVGVHVDEVLTGMEPFQRKLVRFSFHLLDQWPRMSLNAPFRDLGPEEGGVVLLEWLNHERAEIRGLIASVYIFVAMSYSMHPEVSPIFGAQFRCGYGA